MAQTKQGAIIIAAKNAGITVDEYIELSKEQKRCSKCKLWQSRKNFNKESCRSDGLHTKCHSCIRVKVKKSHKGRVSTFKGRTHTDAAKAACAIANTGNKYRLGKTHTLESRKLISQTRRQTQIPRGENHYAYKDGRVADRRGERFSKEYKQWRYDVFLRDSFTCQKCGDKKGGNLNAHHIKPFADFVELRYDTENGITLCEYCHNLEHHASSSLSVRSAYRLA